MAAQPPAGPLGYHDRRNAQSQDCQRRRNNALNTFETTLLNNGFDTGDGALATRVATTGNIAVLALAQALRAEQQRNDLLTQALRAKNEALRVKMQIIQARNDELDSKDAVIEELEAVLQAADETSDGQIVINVDELDQGARERLMGMARKVQ